MSSSRPDTDLEKGDRPAEPIRSTSFRSFRRIFQAPVEDEEENFRYKANPRDIDKIDPPLEVEEELAIFRRLTGIESGLSYRDTKKLNRPDKNDGIYRHVCEEEKSAKKKYIFFSRLINFCLGLQIIVAAALTALGAGNGPHAVVTVFGAINTVIAGFLTYLKGSGLPNRTKFFQNEWGRLRDHIEQQERKFGCKGHGLNVYEQVKIVETMYKDIRTEIEANTPDAYSSVTRGRDKGLDVTHTPSEKGTGSERSGTSTSGLEKKQEE